MSTVENLAPTTGVQLWTEICELYPDEWIWLRDVEDAPNGHIVAGRVMYHAYDHEDVLEQIELGQPHVLNTLIHTRGLMLWRSPRIVEFVDEEADVIRPRP